MKARKRVPFTTVFFLIATSAGAAAQPVPPGASWLRGTTLNLFAGVATASGDSGALVGGAAGWEITPRFGIEGSAAWLDRAARADAFAAALTGHIHLLTRRPILPFLKAGVGLYRASFDADENVPPFYDRRRAGGVAPGGRAIFTDPSLVFGGGVNVFATRHVAIRPEVEAIVVTRQSRTHVVTAVALHVAYHFEEHPVTPDRRTR